MFGRLIIIGALAVTARQTLAAPAERQAIKSETITVQVGQGGAITLNVPRAAPAALQPHALTGETTAVRPHTVILRAGQGDLIAALVTSSDTAR